MTINLTRLRIPSRFVLEGEEVHRVADFKLGLGPCGKTVKALSVKWTLHSLIVTQVHTDRTFKRFIYPRSTITGRIEEEYACD